MPRSFLQSPEQITGEILFGTKLEPVNLTELSHRTGIPVSTLSTYKKHPDMIPFVRIRAIVRARKLSEVEIKRMFGRN